LAVGGVLLVAGLAVALAGAPKAPSDTPLEQAKALVQEKRYQEAIEKLASKEVRQYIDFGHPDDAHLRAFYLARARAFAGAQTTLGYDFPENHRVVVQDFEKAENLARGKAEGDGAKGEGGNGKGEGRNAPGANEGERVASHPADAGRVGLDPSDVSILVGALIALDEIEGNAPSADGGGPGALKRIAMLPESETARKLRLLREVVDHDLGVIVSGGKPRSPGPTKSEGEQPGGEVGGAGTSAESPQVVGVVQRTERTLDLLGKLASDPALAPADKAWVLARQGELLLAAKQPEEAINKLIRRVGLLKDVPQEQQGELYVLLAKAYFQADQPINAMKQLEAADGLLEKSSPLRADLGIMQGRLAQSGVAVGALGSSENDPTQLLEFAREKFESVMNEFGQASGGRHYARALLGVAEVEAALRHDDKSLEKYAELVARVCGRWKDSALEKAEVGAGEKPGKVGKRDLGEVTRERVLTSLMQRFHERDDSGQKESALRYADIAETLYRENETPAEVLSAIGETRRAMGDQLLAQAREARMRSGAAEPTHSLEGIGRDFSVADLDPTTRAEVKRNYIVAGDYLRRHARAIAGTDLGASSKSLWMAADSYDRAGDLEEARKAFADYAQEASDNDPRKAEAKFRLAQIFQAKNPPEYGAAAALYRELQDSASGPDPSRNAGVWADAAVVPLAQCMLADNDPSNDDEAQRLLKGVVDGTRGVSPESEAYREALIELGQSNYRLERFAEAIEWLEQAVKRYKDDKVAGSAGSAENWSGGPRGERMENVRYLLADSHRREGVKIGKTLSTQKLPQSDVETLQASRVEHLTTARQLYDGVRAELEAKENAGKTLSGMEAIELRNAYFYEGDCAMELRAFDAAIASYDAARNKYADDPSSLVAMAQIVSAYAAQEKWAEARTANERARQQLAKFPESAWQNPDLPMEKRHWEKWLEARTLIGQQRANGEGKE
jgi:tetratricopeptide (TPR) repeat protein